MKHKEMIGLKFGNLVVLQKLDSDIHRKVHWLCRCDCGNEISVSGESLRKGHTQSCGCLQKVLTSERFKTHGLSSTRLYKVWQNMKRRCNNPNYRQYSNYGGRGIKVCDEWQEFLPFYEWAMSHGYDENAPKGECTLDRIDVNKGYSPDNCRFANKITQNNNKRTNHFISFNGETHTMKEWSEKTGISYCALESRINKRKWSIERALTTPTISL